MAPKVVSATTYRAVNDVRVVKLIIVSFLWNEKYRNGNNINLRIVTSARSAQWLLYDVNTSWIPVTYGCDTYVLWLSDGRAILSPWWRHQIETFSVLLAICAGNSPVLPVNSQHKGQWRGALMLSLICAWTNGWVNNGEAGDLRRHRIHYDVIVMSNIVCSSDAYMRR